MNSLKITVAVVSSRFYRHYGGLYFLVLLICFGFLSTQDHLALASIIARQTTLTLTCCAAWSLYVVVATVFSVKTFDLKENIWLRNLSYYPRTFQWFALTTTQGAINFPITAYAILISIFTIKYDHTLHLAYIIITVCLGHIIPACAYYLKLRSPITARQTKNVRGVLPFSIPMPVWLWPVWNLVRQNLLSVVGIKCVTILIIYAVIAIDNTEDYDWRWVAIGTLTSIMLNSTLIIKMISFRTERLQWLANIPLKWGKIVIANYLPMVVLAIPECIILVKYLPAETGMVRELMLVIYMIFICSAVYAVSCYYQYKIEAVSRPIFFIYIGMFLLTLFSVPLYFQIMLCLIPIVWATKDHYTISLQ